MGYSKCTFWESAKIKVFKVLKYNSMAYIARGRAKPVEVGRFSEQEVQMVNVFYSHI